MKHNRYLENDINQLCFQTGKMAFVSGPRQCGKTTMAKLLLKQRGVGEYYNWDEVKFRRQWTKDPQLLLPKVGNIKPLIVLDEIHKAKLWKRNLKGLYDTEGENHNFLVTGSARLNIYRKGSDSLMGRYFNFRLHPFSLAELLNEKYFTPPDKLIETLLQKNPAAPSGETILHKLYQFGPFPEPLFAANEKTLQLWRRHRIEKIVREDLRDISHLPELSQIEMLVSLLPERVAQPLSIQAISEDMEVAYTTIKRWLNYLNELYYLFSLRPYSRSLKRSLKKEAKCYLWDWSEIEIKGARFENLVASHLLKYCHYLTDSGFGDFDLHYLKNKEKSEIDFLLTKNKRIFLPIEVKVNEDKPSDAWAIWMKQLKCEVGVQIVMKSNVYRIYDYDTYRILVISANHFLQYLV